MTQSDETQQLPEKESEIFAVRYLYDDCFEENLGFFRDIEQAEAFLVTEARESFDRLKKANVCWAETYEHIWYSNAMITWRVSLLKSLKHLRDVGLKEFFRLVFRYRYYGYGSIQYDISSVTLH